MVPLVEQMSSSAHPLTPYLIGGSIALGIVLATCLAPRRRALAGPRFPPPPPPFDPEPTRPIRPSDDRRGGVRRGGPPTPVLVADAESDNDTVGGWVADRSTGGLGLMLKGKLVPGTRVNVRAANAPESAPWVQLRVCHARRVEGAFLVGCQFMQTPPWNVLLLFG